MSMDTAHEAVETVKDIQAAMRAAAQQLPLLAAKQPPALAAVYARLDPAVVAKCEQARGRMRSGFIEGLREARDALAPSGEFKAWCEANGINYNTAKHRLNKDDHKDDSNQEGAEPAPGPLPDPKPDPKPAKPHKLAFTFANEEDQQRAWKSVERVIKARNLDREAALLYILDVFEGHVLMLTADATAITHAGEAA